MATRSMGPKKSGTLPKDETFVCPHCGQIKKRGEFYVSRDPAVVIGVAFPCKDCSKKIARNYNPKNGSYGDVTPSSLQRACEYLDIPYLQSEWDSAVKQTQDDNQTLRRNVWDAYIKDINSLVQYKGMRWRDSDLFKKDKEEVPTGNIVPVMELLEDDELYKKNKKAVIDFIGYDPYLNYPTPSDLPILYAKLLTFLDEETKNDGMKLNAVIQICKEFNQVEKINASIDTLSADPNSIISNAALIKNLHDASSKALSSATALAKDNGIKIIVPVPGDWFEKYPLNCWKPLRAKLTTKQLEIVNLNV